MFDQDQVRRGREFAAREQIHTACEGAAPPPAPTHMDHLRSQVLEAAERVHAARARLSSHSDRLFGPMPETEAKLGAANGCAAGAIYELQDALTHLLGQVDRLYYEVDRACSLA